MTADELRSALRAMKSISSFDFLHGLWGDKAGWDGQGSVVGYSIFHQDCADWFIHANDEERNALFAIIQKRIQGESND